MTTSQTALLFDITDLSQTVPSETRSYLQERLRNRLYDLVITEFMKQQRERPDLTQAALARRIEKRPEQVNRWLSSPGNWTIDTISDLLVGIAGAELDIGISPFAHQAPRNFSHPKWLDQDVEHDKSVSWTMTEPTTYSPPQFETAIITIGD